MRHRLRKNHLEPRLKAAPICLHGFSLAEPLTLNFMALAPLHMYIQARVPECAVHRLALARGGDGAEEGRVVGLALEVA